MSANFPSSVARPPRASVHLGAIRFPASLTLPCVDSNYMKRMSGVTRTQPRFKNSAITEVFLMEDTAVGNWPERPTPRQTRSAPDD
jgi:hypothetical protein